MITCIRLLLLIIKQQILRRFIISICQNTKLVADAVGLPVSRHRLIAGYRNKINLARFCIFKKIVLISYHTDGAQFMVDGEGRCRLSNAAVKQALPHAVVAEGNFKQGGNGRHDICLGTHNAYLF